MNIFTFQPIWAQFESRCLVVFWPETNRRLVACYRQYLVSTFWYFWPVNLHTKRKDLNPSVVQMPSLLSSVSLRLLLRSALYQIWSEPESVTLCSRSGSFYYSLKVYCHTEGQEVMLVALSACVCERKKTPVCVFIHHWLQWTVAHGEFPLRMRVCRLNQAQKLTHETHFGSVDLQAK